MELSEGKREDSNFEMEEIYQAQGTRLKRAPKFALAKGKKIIKRSKKVAPKNKAWCIIKSFKV